MEPSNRSTHDTAAASSKVSKPNSEARRLQNRIASRNYRQKRKQRLALLDSLLQVDDVVVPPGDPSSSSSSSASPPDQLPQVSSGDDFLLDAAGLGGADVFEAGPALMRAITNHGWRAQPAAQPPPRQHQQHQPHQPPSTIAPSLAFAPSTAFPRHDEGPGISMSFSSRPPLVPQTDDFSPASLSRPRYGNDEGEGDGDRDGDGDDALLPVMEGLQNLSLRQKRELLRHLQRQTEAEADVPGSAGPTATATATPGMLGPPPPSSRELAAARDWASSHGRTPEGVTRLQSEARRFGSFVRRHAASGFSPAQLSRIYSLEVALFGAVFANCYALGMRDVEGLMVEEGVSVFSLDQDTGHPPSQLAALRSRFREITPDLQPCDVQLTFGHHPYIDVLPFRSFRDNALKALQHDPPLFDEDEFCFDFCGGGLICWGSQQSSMGMEAGVPWDARSWEPQVWFLKKYWYLVGGWNDDMWRAARWWHSLRGEKINMHAPEPPATWAPCRKEP